MSKTILFAIVVFTLMIVLKILLKFKIPVWEGNRGEVLVSNLLHRLNPAHYKILNDLLLPSQGNSSTTQIDHVVVSNFGIFCIETKAYAGWIFGSANQKNWTQVIYHNKERFYNPIRQNYAHVKAIQDLVWEKIPKAPVFSLVVFTKAEKLEISGTDSVIFARDLQSKIEGYSNPVLTESEFNGICELLKNADIQDRKIRKLHNKSIRDLKNN